MKELANVIMFIFCICFLLFSCAPKDTGEKAAEIVNAYRGAVE